MTVKKNYDKDLKLYLDIEKELRLNLTLSKKIFLRDLDIKINCLLYTSPSPRD